MRAVATPETGCYSALEELINALGDELRPKVKVVSQPRNTGAGIPDFGLYTAQQLRRMKGGGTPEKPERGAVEIKGPADDIDALLKTEQVERYACAYGLVLVTNYRAFVLADVRDGKVTEIRRFVIAESEAEFWEKTEHPKKTADDYGDNVCEFLRRVLIYCAPLVSPQDIAVMLASYAREALGIIDGADENSSVVRLRTAMESALDMTFSGEKGTHFFNSTLVQTIFYGLFAAWMEETGVFDWRLAAHKMKVPVMRDLFYEIASPGRLDSLGLMSLLDGATADLNRVQDKESLFVSMNAGVAVRHFYEPFLTEFDPELRKNLGVWYTPPEIVRYMVERVDRVLKTELGKADGLADEDVFVLDPCGGTGAYVAEVLRHIHETCKNRGDGDGAAATVKQAAKERIFGFEIIPASYVISHWQIGALLSEMGEPFGENERAAIYLTNSLTNWNVDKKISLGLPGLEEDRDAANNIKREKPVLVVLGNPPYNAFSGTSPQEEAGLVEPYKKDLIKKWGIKKFNLDDLYVRFFRMAQNRITKTGRGIVSFISNYSYAEEPSFVVMREKLLKSFDKIWIENMHGDRNKSERAPDGNSSDTVFAMRGFSPGIRQGVVIGLMLKTSDSEKPALVRYRDDIDAAAADERRVQLLASLDAKDFDSHYEIADPQEWNKLSFRPLGVGENFLQWMSLDALYQEMENGMVEARRGGLINIDRGILEKRMKNYFDPNIDWEIFCQDGNGLTKNASDMDAKTTRAQILKIGKNFIADNLVSYSARAFDDVYCYYTNIRPVWNRNRPKLWQQYKHGNSFFVSRPKNMLANEGAPAFFSTNLVDYGAIPLARCVPFYLHFEDLEGVQIKANLSDVARQYLRRLKFPNPDIDPQAAEVIWLHALAVCYSPQYQNENADGLRIGWPRIPLPDSAERLKNSAALGAKIRALLDMQTPFDGQIDDNKPLTNLATQAGHDLLAADWWGYADSKGKTYPGKGKTEAMQRPEDWLDILGEPIAVCLNETTKWKYVPQRAWDYRIGGFQCAKKWLSYRSGRVLGRALSSQEARTFADMIRRISALILIERKLDENYRRMKE